MAYNILMTPSKEMIEKIKGVLDEKDLKPLLLKRFGSSLDKARFDRKGPGTSDVDMLAVVSNTESLPADPLGTFALCYAGKWTPQFIYRHDPRENTPWDVGRQIHLLVVPEWWQLKVENDEALKSAILANPLCDVFIEALLTGKEISFED
jgi:hypothetical protein